MSPIGTRSADPVSSSAVSGIGKSVLIKGEIYSREDLIIDGEVEGTVELPDQRLTVGPSAKIKADLTSREIVVRGVVTGTLDASEKIEIRKEAKVVGKITTSRLSIEDGAYIKGSVEVTRQAVVKDKEIKPSAVVGAEPLTAAASLGSLN
jgi:cytoskeletal protein CcmA (bactofilin family)